MINGVISFSYIDPRHAACLSTDFKRHELNHLYIALRHVIGLWFLLKKPPDCTGISVVFPSVNHNGISQSPCIMAWNDSGTNAWRAPTFFYQKFAMRSGPGALQFRFSAITYAAWPTLCSNLLFFGFRYSFTNCSSNFIKPFRSFVSTPFRFPQRLLIPLGLLKMTKQPLPILSSRSGSYRDFSRFSWFSVCSVLPRYWPLGHAQ